MPVISINSNRSLYNILKRSNKVVIFFYVNWLSDNNRFENHFIAASEEYRYSGIEFCQVNVDVLTNIREIYNINVRQTPVILFIENNIIVNELTGYRPVVFDVYMYDFYNK